MSDQARPALPDDDDTGTVISLADYTGGAEPRIDPATGDIAIDTDDGGVRVILDPRPQPTRAPNGDPFFRNLADEINPAERGKIIDELMQGIEADERSRQSWLDNRAEGIKMLGTMLEKAQAGDVGMSNGPVEGMSTVRHPLLLEATARFQANASAELYPPSGPVKVRDDQPSKPAGTPPAAMTPGDNTGGDLAGLAAVAGAPARTREEIAEALEKGFNHNLTVVDRGYRPDSVRMLFWVGFGGCAFKKVYDCPVKRRPVSRYVDAEDLIVSNAVSDHRDAERVTHRIRIRSALVKRMQRAGVYRDVELGQPQYMPDSGDEARAAAQGVEPRPPRQEDQPHTFYESYTELDIASLDEENGPGAAGIALPYKVTLDKDSRQMLELRRNWEPEDDTFQARQIFVKYGFIPAMGFYDLGLLHLLGNGDKALTAAWREALDAAMFGNFPGFIYNEGMIRNWTNQNRVPPGGGIGIKGVGNLPLDQVIKPLPYKEVGPGMIGLIDAIDKRMDRVAGTAEMPINEGNQEAPVGTTLALIEQATKVLAAVHIGLHASQSEEFQLLQERYRHNPEAFWRWNRRAPPWEIGEFQQALDDFELVPAADPNTPSHMIRLIRCQAVKMTAQMNPQLYDMKAVDRWIYSMIGVSDPDQFFAPPPDPNAQPAPDPMVMATLATLQQKREQSQAEGQVKIAALNDKREQAAETHQLRLAELGMELQERRAEQAATGQQTALESADRAADRASAERRAVLQYHGEVLKQQAEHQHENDAQRADHAHELRMESVRGLSAAAPYGNAGSEGKAPPYGNAGPSNAGKAGSTEGGGAG